MDLSKNKLTINQQDELLNTLKERFEMNMQRHLNSKWENVQNKLKNNPQKLSYYSSRGFRGLLIV